MFNAATFIKLCVICITIASDDDEGSSTPSPACHVASSITKQLDTLQCGLALRCHCRAL